MNNTRRPYTFDVEIFPNFFCCTFVSIDGTDIKQFVISKTKSERIELLNFCRSGVFLISFNGLSYDVPVLRYIESYRGKDLNTDLFNLSAKLISEDYRKEEEIISLRYPRQPDSFSHHDLMSMMNFSRLGVGLKQASINLKWRRVQDLPFSYNYKVRDVDESVVLDYNLNDALITLELYNHPLVREYRELREGLVDQYGEKILSASKSQMANIILESMYEKETGISRREFKEGRTRRGQVCFSDIIFPEISFEDEKLKSFLNHLKTITSYDRDKYKFSESIHYKGNTFNFGVGGLHTDEIPAKYMGSEESMILSMDVSSFYPAIMCQYNIMPNHLDSAFLNILNRVREERLVAKKKKDTVKAESYKILINSVFGKMGFEDYWLYDPKALLSVTVNGQLFLLMLVERMEREGIHCVSGNTDGIEVVLPRRKYDLAISIAKQWERDTQFELEFVEYKSLIKRDVNAYLAVSTDGKVKEKGIFMSTVSLEKGYQHPIVSVALHKYFVNGVPIEKTIYECKDVLDFCISKKANSDFQVELHTASGIDILQKTNRFYISKSGGALRKRSKKGKGSSTVGLFVGRYVRLLNDYVPETPFDDYKVDVEWYLRETQKIIDLIEPKIVQGDMFSTVADFGKKTTINGIIAPPKSKREKRAKIVTEKDVREAVRTKEAFDVSGRYMAVTGVNTTYSPVITMHSLSKGTGGHKIKIKKNVWASNQLKVGDIIHLSDMKEEPAVKMEDGKFVTVEGKTVWWLNKYNIVTDFSKFKYKE